MFRRKRKNGKSVKNIALFIDGPNIIRKEFGINLDEVRKAAEKYGRIMIGKVFLNQYASEKLVEAVANQGLEPCIVLAGEVDADVDVSVAVAVIEASFNDGVEVIAIASRDADYLPAVQAAKERGKKIVIIGVNPGFSKALQNAADHIEVLSVKK